MKTTHAIKMSCKYQLKRKML
uniref:Uncharacterized protein n=1 Tax=Rhizophora mucronata TaxID=61149 RepID=A0A2P2QCI0_RHIMU